MSRKRRLRTLDAEERALWHHVARSVTPLVRRRRTVEAEVPTAPPPEEPEPALPPAAPDRKIAKAPRLPAKAPAPPALAAIEPRMRRKLSRGAEVDARLDLHGLTQASAHRRLHLFIIEAQALGHAVILVITGKGDPELSPLPGFSERGVLRRAVPLWLAEPAMRAYVVGFETASRRHGGEGALYVRIRRRRDGERP